jgi:hypothetical protein
MGHLQDFNITPFPVSPRGEMISSAPSPVGEVPIAIGREGGNVIK